MIDYSKSYGYSRSCTLCGGGTYGHGLCTDCRVAFRVGRVVKTAAASFRVKDGQFQVRPAGTARFVDADIAQFDCTCDACTPAQEEETVTTQTYTTMIGETIEARETADAEIIEITRNGVVIGTIEQDLMALYVERGLWKEAQPASTTCDVCGAAATMRRPAFAFPWQQQPAANEPDETYCAQHYASLMAAEERILMKYARLAAA